jgi:glutamine amidotransferase
VIVGTERMDEDPGWRSLAPGELLHVGPGLDCDTTTVIHDPPAHLLSMADLDPRAAKSQGAPA